MFDKMENSQFQSFFETQHYYTQLKKQQKLPSQTQPTTPITTTSTITNKVKIKKPSSFECHIQKQSYNLLQALEMQDHIIYAFAKNNQFNSSIILYSFAKQDGSQQKINISSFQHTISAMKFQLFHSDTYDQKSLKKVPSKPYYKLIIGFQNGLVSILDLADTTKLQSFRIDAKKIIQIITSNYELCSNTNICFILLIDSSIYVLNLAKIQIVHMLKPNIIMCDEALSIQLNQQHSFLMQTTKGGYIIFWKLKQLYLQFYQRSLYQSQDKKLRQWSVFPFLIDHNINIQGFIYCTFYGNCLLTIDKNGILKIILINLKMQDEFIILSEYKIDNHEDISYVKFFQQSNTLFIASVQIEEKKCYIQKILISQYFDVYQSKRIYVVNMDVILDFYLIQGCPIIMCRGKKCIGVGLLEQLFEESNKNKQNDQNISTNN